MAKAVRGVAAGFGLGYVANSERGGQSRSNGDGLAFKAPVWRWETLALDSYPRIVGARSEYAGRLFIQGLEWDVPAHGHCDVGVVGAANEPQGIANFEYMFDSADADQSRAGEPVTKENATAQDALKAAAFLEKHYPTQSYAIVAHPSRDLDWTIGDLRALQDAAPRVVCGFEGLPRRPGGGGPRRLRQVLRRRRSGRRLPGDRFRSGRPDL